MRILFITPYYEPDLGPSAPLVTMLCEDLARSGHNISVIAAVPHFPTGYVAEAYRKRLVSRERLNGVDVTRVWVPSGKRSSLSHRLLVFVVYQILASTIGLGRKYDLVMLTNPAIETGLPFALLAWLRRKPSVWAVWDLYPEVGVWLGIFRSSFVIGVVKALEDFCLKRASVVHALAGSFTSNLRLRAASPERVIVIPPWLDTDFIKPLDRINSFSLEYGLGDGFNVMYAGNMGFSQGLENLIYAASRLANRPEIRFVFVGEGPCRPDLEELVRQMRLENVVFLPFQPRTRLPEVLATADLSVVSLLSGIGVGSIPSKTFPILASGRPVLAITEEENELGKVVIQSEAGLCVSPNDPDAVAHAILKVQADSTLRHEMMRRARAHACRYYSRQKACQSFEALFTEIINRNEPR